jgi:dienelactone hydrolase
MTTNKASPTRRSALRPDGTAALRSLFMRLLAYPLLLLVIHIGGTQAQSNDTQPGPPESKVAPLVFGPDTVGPPGSNRLHTLYTPTGPGPFPAVVVLHTCGGVTPHEQDWGQRLAGWGFVAIVVNSFATRGVVTTCDAGHTVDLTPWDRAADALRAAAYLRTLPNVAPARLGTIGFSAGGGAAVRAALRGIVTRNHLRAFRAAIALYPNCPEGAGPNGNGFGLASDELILMGGSDEWTPPRECVDFAHRVNEGSHVLELHIYPGAVHGFDQVAPMHKVYGGHIMGGTQETFDDVNARVKAFFATHMPPGGD